MKFYTLKIVDIIVETEDAKTICFKQPGLKKVKYQPGQYLTLIFRINGRRYIRPYSFSSAPEIDPLLNITVKRIPGGIVSNHIHDLLKIGDSIEVMEPMGDFTYTSADEVEDIYFWGVGSGITPLYSLIKNILSKEINKKVYLVYGNRNEESTIFSKELKELKQAYPHLLNILYFNTQCEQDNPAAALLKGRICETKVLEFFNGQLDKSSHYICGPAELKEAVKYALKSRGVNPDFIYAEDFNLVLDPEEFNDIKSEIVKLKFKEEVFDLEIVKGSSILDAALNANIELPYSCQTGTCDTCKGTLVNGKLKTIGITRNQSEDEASSYLLCCSYPMSNDVYIEV